MRDNASMASRMHCCWLWSFCLLIGCGTSSPAPTSTPAAPSSTLLKPETEPLSNGIDPPTRQIPQVEPVLTQLPPATPQPQIVYRPADDRPRHNDEQLAELGIRRWASRHLILYSDVEPEAAQHLPALVDQLYAALTDYFGPLPPAKDGRDFQMTGYLIGDLAVFRETGLVPEDLPTFEHGRHRRYEFWLRDQPFDYYRAHLLLHEATHCFMTIMPDQSSPVWYLEGMAEFFGTHQQDTQGRTTFGIFPERPDDVPGWGRITLIRQAIADGQPLTLPDIFKLDAHSYGEPTPYAWSWAACEFLARHPDYRHRFQELGRTGRGPGFSTTMHRLFSADQSDLAKEWQLFIHNLQYGYDLDRAAIDFMAGKPLVDLQTVKITANRGWQSTAVLLQVGQTYQITTSGQVVLASEPKPWISEANGITIDYSNGQPLGRLLACIDPETPSAADGMEQVFPLSTSRKFTAPVTGTLYLRVNDGWNQLADNTGSYSVLIEQSDSP